jgi:uncharacterized protein with gpF-like domain
MTPNKNQKVLPPVHANSGIEAAYRKRLEILIKSMHDSLVYWLSAAYKKNIAMDATPAEEMQERMNLLGEQWLNQFSVASRNLAEWFAQKTRNYADGALKKILLDAGIAIDFKMTDEMMNIHQAMIQENVSLIKSIAEQHLRTVEGLVMRSVQQGGNLGDLTDELRYRYSLTSKRAALIARDQNSKANAMLNKARQEELGIKQAVWKHSHAGKKPRPEHVAFNNHVYDVEKGAYLEGEWVWPGTAINCRCTSRSILPSLQSKHI